MKYNRQFARRQWRQSFQNKIVWQRARWKGLQASFRNFIAPAPKGWTEIPAGAEVAA